MATTPNNIVRIVRQAYGITTTKAAQLVYVTRRTWEIWESGERQIPKAKLELFISKIYESESQKGELKREIIVIIGDNMFPIDVVAEGNYIDFKENFDGTATIRSLAVDREGSPYIHSTNFRIDPNNKNVKDKTSNWKSILI